MRILFGTDGIRGKAHQYPLDPPTMFKLGVVLARRYPGTILIGRDTRESGPEIAGALAAGIAEQGGKAVVVGVIPTPPRGDHAGRYVAKRFLSDTAVATGASSPRTHGVLRFILDKVYTTFYTCPIGKEAYVG